MFPLLFSKILIGLWGSSSEGLENVEYSFIVITVKSILTRSGSIYQEVHLWAE